MHVFHLIQITFEYSRKSKHWKLRSLVKLVATRIFYIVLVYPPVAISYKLGYISTFKFLLSILSKF